MKNSKPLIPSFKACFYALLLASSLDFHHLHSMKKESSLSENIQEESPQHQGQQPQNNPMIQEISQDNPMAPRVLQNNPMVQEISQNNPMVQDVAQNNPIAQYLPQHPEGNTQENLDNTALSPRRLAQQTRLKEFLHLHPLAKNLSGENITINKKWIDLMSTSIVGKSWIDIMSTLHDPSKEFLVDIGFYIPEEGEDIANTSYEFMIEKGEKDLKIKIEKEDRELEEKLNKEKLNNKNFQQLMPAVNNDDNDEDTEQPLYEGDVFFYSMQRTFRAPSFEHLSIGSKDTLQHEKLNNNLIAFEDLIINSSKNKKMSENFYENYITYCQKSKDAFSIGFDNYTKLNHFPEGKASVAKQILTRNKFYTTYIQTIYTKLLGLLFENVDLFDDFSYIINTLDFEQERVSRLKKAIANLLSPEDSLAFSLCALSFTSLGYGSEYEHDNLYSAMFYLQVIFDDFYFFDRGNIDLSHQLECLDEKGQTFFKFLSFKNTVNFQNSQQCFFKSLDKVNFSQGISLVKKTLNSYHRRYLRNVFDEKILELKKNRKNIWLFLEDYFNQDSSSKDCRLNIFKRVATLGLLMTKASPQDYTEFLNNILLQSYQEKKELFVERILAEKAELCFDYDYFDNTISSPLWEQNEENIAKAIKIFAQNTFRIAQESHILNKNNFFDLECKNYYKKNLLLVDFDRNKKEDIMDNFITTRALYFYTIFLDFCKENDYDTDPLLGIIAGTKRKITLFNQVKKFHLQGLKQIIGSDIKSMRLLLTCFKKEKKNITSVGINEIFGRINAFHMQLFPFCSNYNTFCYILDHASTLNSQFFSTNRRNLSLEEVQDIIATELAVFYFSTYRTFSIHQGITSRDDYARSLNVDYIDPVFLHIKILCSEKLVPLLVQIGQCNKTIKFTLLEKPLTK